MAYTYLDAVLGASRASEGPVGVASASLEYSWSSTPRRTSPPCRVHEEAQGSGGGPSSAPSPSVGEAGARARGRAWWRVGRMLGLRRGGTHPEQLLCEQVAFSAQHVTHGAVVLCEGV